MSKITVLGMGAMGSRMAASLIKAGHEVTVWSRNRDKTTSLVEAGARVADSPRAAVEEAEFAVCMVRDDDASRYVWLDNENGALKALPKGATAIESSTVTFEWARELAEQSRLHGIAFLDAPVVGSRPQAEAAQLISLVGGDAGTVAKAEPILKAMGGAVHHTGDAGSGAAVKLMVNALFGVQVAAMGELIGLMRSCGVDEAKAVEIVSATPVCSPAAKVAAGAMLARNFAPLFPIELVEKDFGYVVDTAEETNARVPMAEAARRILAEAIEQGYGADNLTGVVQLYLSESN